MQASAITALKNAYPESHLTVLSHDYSGTSEVCRLMPSIDEVIDIGIPGYTRMALLRYFLARFWNMFFKLRRRRYDLVVSFVPNPVRRLFVLGVARKYWIYGNATDGFPGKLSLDILERLEIASQGAKDVFKIPEPGAEKKALLQSCMRPIIGIHPFCGSTWRQWNHFESLIRRVADLNATVLVVGRRAAYDIDADVTNLVNKLSIDELFWVIGKCDAFITADSGPMHIAFALDVPTVAIFGAVKPSLRVPEGREEKIRVLYKPSDVSERIDLAIPRKQLDNQAMQSITVDEVMDETMRLLREMGHSI
ncbi:MAG: glycosyltransferase family 9 protein [Planctomycetota bacterium]